MLCLNILKSKMKTNNKPRCRTNEPHLLWSPVRRLLESSYSHQGVQVKNRRQEVFRNRILHLSLLLSSCWFHTYFLLYLVNWQVRLFLQDRKGIVLFPFNNNNKNARLLGTAVLY